jgi:transcription initiation factor IIE alpha subunit
MMMTFRSRNTDPATSWMAAAQADDLAKDHAIIIVDCLQKYGALGKDGIMLLSKLDKNQISRRLPELERQGLIKQTGQLVKSLSNRLEREWAFQPQQRSLI